MKVEEAFEDQVSKKPESDTFTVFAINEDTTESDDRLLKFAVDFTKLDEFYERIEKQYECVEFHEDTSIPILKKK